MGNSSDEESDIKRIGEGRLKKVYNQLKAGKYKVENANVKIGEMEKGDYLHQVHVEGL